VGDPVESDSYGYDIGGVLVTDFATPAWFGFAHAGTRSLDFQGHLTAAFAVGTGGYAQKYDPATGWTQVNGERARTSGMAHVLEPQEGSRRERRTRTGGWKLSEHRF